MCKGLWENKDSRPHFTACFFFFFFFFTASTTTIKLQWKTLTHKQVSQSIGHPWDSSIWFDALVCVRHAFKMESFLGDCSCATGKKTRRKWRQRHPHNTNKLTALTNATTGDNTVTSANVRDRKMQTLPPVDMQLWHHHEKSTALIDRAFAGYPLCKAALC